MRRIELTVVLVGAISILISAHGWMQNRSNQQSLQTLLAQKQKAIEAATASEEQTEAGLAKTIAEIEALKRRTHSPEEAAKALSGELSKLPVPIQIQSLPALTPKSSSPTETMDGGESPARARKCAGTFCGDASSQTAGTPRAIVAVPAPDLKPLFDSAEKCNEAEARLAATQSELADEKAKSDALEKQRNIAIVAEKGGSGWKRFGRAAKWIAIGAIAGGALARR